MRFLKHLGMVALIGFLLVVAVFYLLAKYTRHGETILVPELKGLSVADISRVLEREQLAFAINDSVYNTSLPPGTAISQNPAAGSQVKKGRTIFLIMNASEVEMVNIPRVVGISLRQADRMLTGAGLRIGRLSYVPDIARNNVLAVSSGGRTLSPGHPIAKGSVIDLTLGLGEGQRNTSVPQLLGKSYREALDLLQQAQLNRGTLHFDNSVKNGQDSLKAVVFKQIPSYSPAQQAVPGEPVSIWLTVNASIISKISTQPDETTELEEEL